MFPDGIDTVLFDAGGTLVHIDYDRVAEVVGGAGGTVDRARLPEGDAAARLRVDERLTRLSADQDNDAARVGGYFHDLLVGAGMEAGAAAEFGPRVRAAHLEENLWRVPYADAAGVLARLRGAGLATGVISNADGRVRAVLERAGLADGLDYVIDSHEEGVEKPDPEIFHRAVARSGTAAERAIYVGDIYTVDVLGARAAGLAPCLLDPFGRYAERECARAASLTAFADALLSD